MNILGIETSCDETAVALVKDGKLLSNVVASQDQVHAPHGGVVPELASRAHIEKIQSLVELALREASISLEEVNAIAVTQGPGLLGSLLVGLSYAKALAYAQNIPFCGVDHLEAHLHAIFLEKEVTYPHIGLLVSGGHTALYDIQGVEDYKLLGTTVDDAVGEAFDKVAKILGLGYPGGRVIDELSKKGNSRAISFPRLQSKEEIYFSFSGLKTAVFNFCQKKIGTIPIEDVCASFQEAAIEILLTQTLKALEIKKYNRLVIAGGVAANSRLREVFGQICREKDIELFIPSLKLCTDNAAMIAALGYHKIKLGKHSALSLAAYATRKFCEL